MTTRSGPSEEQLVIAIMAARVSVKAARQLGKEPAPDILEVAELPLPHETKHAERPMVER